MTFAALFTFVVLNRVYSRDIVPAAGRRNQLGVTANAKFPAAVDCQFFRIVGVIQSRAMAVFARDHGVLSALEFLDFIIVTIIAVLGVLVL
jgi:hypothetical protein